MHFADDVIAQEYFFNLKNIVGELHTNQASSQESRTLKNYGRKQS